MPAASDHLSDELANNLFTELSSGVDFTLPAVDLTTFTLPDEADNPIHGNVKTVTEATLTTRKVDGTGIFDGIMAALTAHLDEQYTKNRITGKEYAEVYIQNTSQALSAAVQFALQKDQAYWQAILAQQQAKAAEAQVVIAHLGLEEAKARTASARIETNTMAANFSLTKLKLAAVDADRGLTVKQTEQADYEITFLQPAELASRTAQTRLTDYNIDYVMPKEVDRIQSAIDTSSAEISRISAAKDQTLYETANILPAQKANINADADVKIYTATNVLPAQVSDLTIETAKKTFEKDFVLPAQISNINEQMESHRAKTLDYRSDGTTPVVGSIGKQKDLHQQQIDSYKRDSEAKVAKMILDTWITQKSMDEGAPVPTSLANPNIETIMGHLQTNLGLS